MGVLKSAILKSSVSCLGLFLLSWGLAVAEDGVSPGRILIGQNISLQGGKNEHGVAVIEGIKLHLDSVNRNGGIFGRKIELKTLDDEASSAKAESNARALVNEDKVFVLFGSIEGGPSTAVMKVATEAQVPFIGPLAGAPTLRTPHNPHVFPLRADHKEEFKSILNHASAIGLKHVGFMRSASEVGQLHLENVKKIAIENRMEFKADLPFGGDLTDAALDAMVLQIERDKVQVVINHGGVSAYERLIKKARAKGLATVFYGVNSASAQLAAKLGNLSTGMGFTQVVPNPRAGKVELTRIFRAEYATAYPAKTPTYGTLEGFLTAQLLVQAVKRAGPNPTRASLKAGFYAGEFDLNGYKAVYRPGNHIGLTTVDLSVVSRDGVFIH